MAAVNRQWRTGSEDILAPARPARHERYTESLSDAANLSIGTWNCGGLSKLKKDIILKRDLDIACLTETHGWRDDDPLSIYSDTPNKDDKFSGVALIVNKRVARYITSCIGSRIIYCRLRGLSCNIYIVGAYIPRKGRTNPDQNDTYNLLESFLLKISQRDCVILMGDFNSRLSRDVQGRVGRWCIHTRRDSGGDRLHDIMELLSLRCVSTYFQPRRRHSNATFMNIQPEKAPSQIDYIIVSSRWASSVRTCSTKWGVAIEAYGRKYDHALVQMNFRLRLKCDRGSQRKDFSSLKLPSVAKLHEDFLQNEFASSDRPTNLNEQWNRLSDTLQKAQSTIPNVKRSNRRKWETSVQTHTLVKQRAQKWSRMNVDERKTINKDISRSARNDYRDHVNSVLTDIEKEGSVGNITEVYRLSKSLSTKRSGNAFVQPSVDLQGNEITSSEQQLEAWAVFLEEKFAARPNEPEIDLQQTPANEDLVPDIDMEEVKVCVTKQKHGKAVGPDGNPVEQYQASDSALKELHHLLLAIWQQETVPDDFVLADMMMLYKKKCKDTRGNYRALALLNHGYKTFATVLLLRILPYISPKLSDMQAGFRKSRGCRDNILILIMTIQHLLKEAEDDARSQGIITYIDFTAAFDSILHSYLLGALKQYGVPLKYCRLVKAIYDSAKVRVRLQSQGGNKSYSRSIPVNRGVIQGDVPSPVCFLVALDRILREHGGLDTGIRISDNLLLSDLEFADDAALPNEDTDSATNRLTTLDIGAKEEAGMIISIPKTKVQHIRKRPTVSSTTENDILNLPAEKKFKFECDKCSMTYPTKHGLSVHKGRWCKKRKTAKKPSRKGTVADRIITRQKIEDYHQALDKVKIGTNTLENVYSFVYLGAEIASDGDPEVTVKHRCDIAWARFNEYRKVLTAAKLPVDMRIRLLKSLVTSAMIYGSSAWLFTNRMKQKLNGVNSKMLSLVTRRSIHDEARQPTFDVVEHVMSRRWEYLGHILRLDDHRALRRYLLELSPAEQPFPEGSLLADTNFQTIAEMNEAASDRNNWKAALERRRSNEQE